MTKYERYEIVTHKNRVATRRLLLQMIKRCRSRLHLFLFFCFAFTSVYLNAQSIFSFKEEGESVLSGDAHMAALGYGEIPGTFSSNLCGSIAFIKKSGIDLTYSSVRLQMKDDKGRNILHYYGLPYLKAASTLPLGLAMGFNIRKAMDFNANFITDSDSVNGVTYKEMFSKKGQLSVGKIEIAKRIGNISGLGLGLDILFGGSNEVWITNFSDTLYKDTEDSLNTSYFGHSYSLGVIFDLHPLSIVFGYSFPISCEKVTKSLSIFRKDTTQSVDELIYPSLYSCGCDLSLREDLNLLFTIRYRDWSNFQYNGMKKEGFMNVLSYSIGLEYSWGKGYKERGLPLRLGYFSKPWYFKDSYNKKIQDNGFTVGTSIPILKKNGFLDIGFVAGRRNTEELEERYYNLHLGFNFYERW